MDAAARSIRFVGIVFILVALPAVLALGVRPAYGETPAERFAQACQTDNPFMVTTLYSRGGNWDEPALIAFNNTRDNSGHVVLATMRQIGAAYGVAYQPQEQAIYVAAYHKRGSPFSPQGGPGTIYRVDVVSGAVEPWLEVPNAGRDQHDRAGGYFPDTRATNYVGNLGLADIDLNEDGSELYVMHLPDRLIYRYRVTDKSLLGRISVGSEGQPFASQARPFGLKVWQGRLYHGVVNTAYQSQDRGDLRAYVYESDLDGANMRSVTDFSLDYGRGNVFGNAPARWWPWKDGYNSVVRGPIGAYPQPMLSDIEFADSGDMIIAFRDRFGDMTFYDPGGRNPPGEGTGIPAGDILLGRIGEGNWTTNPKQEHYDQDAGPGVGRTTSAHDESSFGGLARVQGVDRVVMCGMAPERISSGGAYWFDNQSGSNPFREEIYNIRSEVNYGKANGLGDVEILCGSPERETPTPTPPDTATPTLTATSTMTPTVTATGVASVTPSRSATASATRPVTVTVSATPRASATLTPVPTTPSATRPATGTAPPRVTTPPPRETPTTPATTPPEDTPEQPKTPVPDDSPTPAPTPQTPGLPKTGADDLLSELLLAIGALAILLGTVVGKLRRAAFLGQRR